MTEPFRCAALVTAGLLLAGKPLAAQAPSPDVTLYQAFQQLHGEYRALTYRFSADAEPVRDLLHELEPIHKRLDSLRAVRRGSLDQINAELRSLRYAHADDDPAVVELRAKEVQARATLCAITPDDFECQPANDKGSSVLPNLRL